jgi:hypothetical protein
MEKHLTQILKNILLGNKRFVEDKSIHPRESPHRRKEIANHQIKIIGVY